AARTPRAVVRLARRVAVGAGAEGRQGRGGQAADIPQRDVGRVVVARLLDAEIESDVTRAVVVDVGVAAAGGQAGCCAVHRVAQHQRAVGERVVVVGGLGGEGGEGPGAGEGADG